MSTVLTGDHKARIGTKLFELGRQVFNQKEYGFNPDALEEFLQRAIEGRFNQEQKWYEKDDIIYFSVTSDGTTGENWITRLERKGFRIGEHAKIILLSSGFKPTTGVITKVAILKGTLFKVDDRSTRQILAEATNRRLFRPNAELACLIRDKFTDEDIKIMGLSWIITMHESVKKFTYDSYFLGTVFRGGYHWLGVRNGKSGYVWDRSDGFAFIMSQVSTQS